MTDAMTDTMAGMQIYGLAVVAENGDILLPPAACAARGLEPGQRLLVSSTSAPALFGAAICGADALLEITERQDFPGILLLPVFDSEG